MNPIGRTTTQAVVRASVFPQLVQQPSAAERAARIRAGDAAAFEEFFRELYPAVVAVLRHRTGSLVAAEDVAQDAFVALWERRSSIDPARSLRAYVFRSAFNLAVSRSRRQRIEQRVRGWLQVRSPAPRTPADDLARGELARALDVAIAALPARCREVFLLSRDAHLSYAEIASALSLSAKTVENHMGRALRLLRHSLEPFR